MARILDKRQVKPDVGYHDRRLARRLQEDPEFRAEFKRQRLEIDTGERGTNSRLIGSTPNRSSGRCVACCLAYREVGSSRERP
jgi:hypothetical protein